METFELEPFELVDYVGEGTMGRVYRGVHPQSGVDVAVKVMTSELAREAHFRRGFRREVQAMAQLTHPAVAAVYDLGEIDPETADRAEGLLPEGSPWLAMEYVEGISVSKLPESWGWHRLQWVLLEVLDALAHSHAVGVIHRDLKPSNILVQGLERGVSNVKIVDFGVARILDPDREAEQHDIEERIAGTPKYMAPEQLLGQRRRQGPWTDLYAVGCLAWALLTGAPPFDEDEVEAIFESHLKAPLPEFNPRLGVPEGLERWLASMLQKDPYRRFRRAADASHALLELTGLARTSEPEMQSSELSSPDLRSTIDVALEETAAGETPPEFQFDSGQFDAEMLRGEGTKAVREWSLPPIPEKWRHPKDEGRFRQLRGAGLGLFGLRRIPVVDRGEERTNLWGEFTDSAEQERPKMVVLHGPMGSGKNRLAGWLVQRAHEVGTAYTFHARHSERGNPRDGLGAMLARRFRCVGMAPYKVVDRLERIFEFLGVSGSEAYHDIRGLAQLMGAEGEPRRGFESPGERYRAIVRLLEHLGRLRASVLWLQDVHYGAESLAFAEHVIGREADDPLPVTVVATVADDVLNREDEMGEIFGALQSREGVEFVEVGALDLEAQRQFVEQLLGLEPSTADEVARRTEGNPMFAVQLIQDWVEREKLALTSEGFAIPDESEPEVPDDIRELWRQRIDDALEGVPDDQESAAREAIEVVAALGTGVTHREWRTIAERRQLAARGALLDEMFRHGLVERRDDGWSFAHGLLRETIEHEVRQQGEWSRRQEECADLLLALHDLSTPGIPGRVAEHLEEAGELESALHYYNTAAQRSLDAAEFEEARRLIQNQRRLIDELDAGPGRFEVRFQVARGELQGQIGEPNDALEWAERGVELARKGSWEVELGSALRLRASLRREMGRLDGALRDAREALDLFATNANKLGLARSNYILGRIHQVRGDIDEAEARYTDALDWYRQLGDVSMEALTICELGYLATAREEYERARGRLEQSLEVAREVGNRNVAAKSWNRLGEVARFEQDREEARRCYRKAEELFQAPRHRHVANLNLAFVELADGEYTAAESYLTLLEKSFERSGIHYPQVMIGLSCCDAAEGEWEAWDEDFDAGVASLEESGMAHADIPWLAEKSGKLCRYSGEIGRAKRAFALAAYQWANLGDTETASAIKSLIDGLDQ